MMILYTMGWRGGGGIVECEGEKVERYGGEETSSEGGVEVKRMNRRNRERGKRKSELARICMYGESVSRS